MNQITWNFGFCNENFQISEKQKKEWKINDNKRDIAEDYSESALKHLNTLLSKRENYKVKEWLKKTLEIKRFFRCNGDFTKEANGKIKLLLAGHILELEENQWFKDYLKDPDHSGTTIAEIKKVFDYSDWSDMKNNWRRKLLAATGIVICPYCDRQYISYYSDEKTTAELDHFYPKDDYPLFSLSLFNFIPACHICNALFKLKKRLYVYPYRSGFDKDVHFEIKPFEQNEREGNFFVDFVLGEYEDDIKIEQVVDKDSSSKESFEEDIKTLKLNEVYNVHQDYVKTLFDIRRLYENDDYKDQVEKLLNDTMNKNNVPYPVTNENIRLFLTGETLSDNNDDNASAVRKRPLSTLTSAVFNDKIIIGE